MKKEEVTRRMKQLMLDADRALLFPQTDNALPPGHHDCSSSQAGEDYLFSLEKQEHIHFENFLNQHELGYDHQRMDRRATNKQGIPDFIVGVEGLLVAIEFKRKGNKLSPAQEEWRRRFVEKSKCEYHVFEFFVQARDLILCRMRP